MSAKRKIEDVQHQPAAPQAAPEPGAPPVEDVSGHMAAAPSASPARELQERLEQSVHQEPPTGRVIDLGRVLASASGITAILGVFFFSGLW